MDQATKEEVIEAMMMKADRITIHHTGNQKWMVLWGVITALIAIINFETGVLITTWRYADRIAVAEAKLDDIYVRLSAAEKLTESRYAENARKLDVIIQQHMDAKK